MAKEVENAQNVQNVETKKENKSKIYRLDEMADAMEASKANAEKILAQQVELIEYLKKSESDTFKQLISDMEKQNKSLKHQIATLEHRHTLLLEVLEDCKQENITKVIDKFVDAIGMFND